MKTGFLLVFLLLSVRNADQFSIEKHSKRVDLPDVKDAKVPKTPINCVFIGDQLSYGSEENSGYLFERALIRSVAHDLYTDPSLDFNAGIQFFGYTGKSFDSTFLSCMLRQCQFDDICKVDEMGRQLGGLEDAIKKLNNDFKWEAGTSNKCLVFVSAATKSITQFTAHHKFDAVIGVALPGSNTSVVTGSPILISSYSTRDVTQIVNTIRDAFLPRTTIAPTTTATPKPTETFTPIPINCVFVGDKHGYGNDYNSHYTREQTFIQAVGDQLHDNQSYSFGASLQYFGYTGVSFSGDAMNSPLDQPDFDAAAASISFAGNYPFPSRLFDVISYLNNCFTWTEGTPNTCLVLFSATIGSTPFTAANKFDTVVGVALPGSTTSAVSDSPILTSSFSTKEVTEVVEAIQNSFLNRPKPTPPKITKPTVEPTTKPHYTPINCVFLGDMEGYGANYDSNYTSEQTFIQAVGDQLYDSSLYSFGASIQYFGYTGLDFSSDGMNTPLDKMDFDSAAESNSFDPNYPFNSQLSDVIAYLNNGFSWNAGTRNTCLVLFSATIDSTPFTAANKFDTVVGVALPGATTSVVTTTPIVATDYSQATIDQVVQAILGSIQ